MNAENELAPGAAAGPFANSQSREETVQKIAKNRLAGKLNHSLVEFY
jgi:hypothetical protein